MLIDAAGNEHEPAQSPCRIVSLVPSLTELLFDLDLQDELVGRTDFCIEPEGRVEKVAAVGGTKTADLERLLALKPTHVLVNIDETPKDVADRISASGISVVVTHPNKPADNLALFGLIGGLFGRQQQAAKLSADLQGELMAGGDWPQRKVLYLIWKRPWMTISRDTYIAEMLKLFGMQTLYHDPEVRYPEVSIDAGLLAQADLILFSTEPFPFALKHRESFARDFNIAEAPKLLTIDGKMVSWYGSRAVEGLRYLRDFTTHLN
ncbi:MAG: helical backbone metal receptor [Alphaproteobacteria bacterium]